MKKVHLLVIFTLIIFTAGVSDNPQIKYSDNLTENEEYEVILMGGQSNMVGHGKKEDLQEIYFENISYFNFGLNANLKKPYNKFGPEVGISMELKTNFPNKKIILIKYAIGGASLLDWAPDYKKEKAIITGHPEFGNMYKKLITLTDSLTKNLNAKIAAFVWMQGERDAKIPEAGINYYNNFKTLIDSLRSDLNNQNLPIIFGEINPPGNRYPALDKVVNSQLKIVNELPNTYIINTENIEKWNDDLHYSSNGQIELGRKFGKQLTELLKKLAHNKQYGKKR